MQENIGKMLDRVLGYTNFHFAEEERFMAGIGYPLLGDQKRMHAELREKMAGLKEKHEARELKISLPVTNELKDWLNNHILVEDRKYAKFYLDRHRSA
jgi:hemerythrin-like metal-binding protein